MSVLMAGGSGFLERLNTREKLLLLLMVVLFGSMGAFVLFKQLQGSLTDIDAEIARYDQALTLLMANREDFANRIERAQWIEERLRGEPIQMRSFIERACIDTGVERPTNYSDNVIPQRDAQSGEARIVEIETRATIAIVEALPLSRLLNRLANSGELVILKSIDLQPSRGNPGAYRVDLTLSTYRLDTSS